MKAAHGLLALAFLITLIVLIMTLSIYFYYLTPVSKFSFQATAMVTEDLVGFDVNSTALTFGSIAVGGSSTRSILVNNSYSFPVRVESVADGNIAEIINFEPLVVGPYQTSKLSLNVYAGSYDMLGNYTGNVRIRLMRL